MMEGIACEHCGYYIGYCTCLLCSYCLENKKDCTCLLDDDLEEMYEI